MGALFSKPKVPPPPAPIEMPKTPVVDQVMMDRDRADMMRRRQGRAATVLAGKSSAGSGALPAGATATKSLLGQ